MKQTSNFFLFGISIILLGATLFLNISHTVITNESIVLVFVGILATFIVVGNYAQVTDIRNSTNNQIIELESKTQQKIEELNKLYAEIIDTSHKIEKIEKNMDFNAAEAYRLYGVVCYDKKLYRNSCVYLLQAVSLYTKDSDDDSNALLDLVVEQLVPEKWNHKSQLETTFKYEKYIKKVSEFPEKYKQKEMIINSFENFKIEEKKNNII